MSNEDTLDCQYEPATCVVCGKSAAGNGLSTCINHRGHTLNLCGGSCMGAFRRDPDSYLARLREAFETWQRHHPNREALLTQTL